MNKAVAILNDAEWLDYPEYYKKFRIKFLRTITYIKEKLNI